MCHCLVPSLPVAVGRFSKVAAFFLASQPSAGTAASLSHSQVSFSYSVEQGARHAIAALSLGTSVGYHRQSFLVVLGVSAASTACTVSSRPGIMHRLFKHGKWGCQAPCTPRDDASPLQG
ncbi:hypothetical protein J1614_008575 [Plenodomus biglobosus]|nr:hypothetical protein J1614_008575 [Plenodomus biglobosus]